MQRGDIVTVAAGDCGKPRPSVVIQGDIPVPGAQSSRL
jgi:mRNA-degrading endonuclease toxin of MazEF toxin-antitoxin module